MSIQSMRRAQRVRSDDVFFPAMALMILGVVVVGFWPSYVGAGMVMAKLPSPVVHIHAAIFVSWIVLLVAQNFLVAARRIKWHIALGVLGVVLPPLMVVFGVMTTFEFVRRQAPDVLPRLIVVGDFEQLSLFVILVAWAMVKRRSPAAHKRLMTLGTLAIMGPAINRFPFPDRFALLGTILIYLGLPLLVVAYDVWSLRRVHRTTVVGTAAIVVVALTIVPVSQMGFMRGVVEWMR
jgi:hypothetical protein